MQQETLDRILEAYGKGIQVCTLLAPTGSGKSLLAVSLARMIQRENPFARAVILTASKELQDQYQKDYGEFTGDFRGKENYYCPALKSAWLPQSLPRPCQSMEKKLGWKRYEKVKQDFPIKASQNPHKDCPVRLRRECPYYQAKDEGFLPGSITVTNYANYAAVKKMDEQSQQGWGEPELLIMDEGHRIEDLADDLTKAEIDEAELKELEGQIPQEREFHPLFWKDTLKRLSRKAKAKGEALEQEGEGEIWSDAERLRKAYRWKELARKTEALSGQEGTLQKKEKYNGTREWGLRANQPGPIAQTLLMEGAKRQFITSATLAMGISERLGLEKARTVELSMPSLFPPKLSPIRTEAEIRAPYLFQYKDEQEEERIRNWIRHLDKTLRKLRESGRKVLIITPSHRHVEYIAELSELKEEIICVRRGSKGQPAARFREEKGWCALAGAYNLAEGHNFEGETAEATIIPKLWSPPDFQEKVNRIREKVDPLYHERRKAQWFTQAVGRAVRSETDRNETLVTDADWERWSWKVKGLLPGYILERIEAGKGD